MPTTKIELSCPLPLTLGKTVQEQLVLRMYDCITGKYPLPVREDVTEKGIYSIAPGASAKNSWPSHKFVFESSGNGGKLQLEPTQQGSRRKTHEVVDNEGNILKRRGKQRLLLGEGKNGHQLLGIARRGRAGDLELTAALMYSLPLSDPRKYSSTPSVGV